MKASDLMIGDWIMYGDKPVQVLQLTVDKVYRGFSPIPLTPEILEKNGWSEDFLDNNLGHHFPEDELLKLELYVEDGQVLWTINCYECVIMPLDFVHELQHALKLCGIDKEIIL